jgi:hypothetical protein
MEGDKAVDSKDSKDGLDGGTYRFAFRCMRSLRVVDIARHQLT